VQAMTSSFPVLVAAVASVASAQSVFMFELTGACAENNALNGLSWINVGNTLSGAPFYKALGHEYYIYHDPDCANSGDGSPRWIIGETLPNSEAESDLDGDQACVYVARVDSSEISSPPSGEWVMSCGGVQKKVELALESRDPETTSEAPGESTTDSSESTTPGESMPSLTLSGVCEYHQAWEGLVFEFQGATADGSPYYKATDVEEYLYYDADCDGSGAATGGRWVLDDSRPSTKVLEDLDRDQECNYHARLEASSGSGGPEESATWHMYCGDSGWEAVELTLTPNAEDVEDVLVAAANGLGSALVFVFALVLVHMTRMFDA